MSAIEFRLKTEPSGDGCLFGSGSVVENGNQCVDPCRLEAHNDGRAWFCNQHHFPPALPYCLGRGDERSYPDRGKKMDADEVDHYAFPGHRRQCDELRGDRVGTRRIETAGDHDTAEVLADVVIADGHDRVAFT